MKKISLTQGKVTKVDNDAAAKTYFGEFANLNFAQ